MNDELDDMIDEVNDIFDNGVKPGELSNRDVANAQLLDLLTEYLTKYSDQRFGQMLYNLGLSGDMFNEESQVTLKRVKDALTKFSPDI